jgi:hypothetical protein
MQLHIAALEDLQFTGMVYVLLLCVVHLLMLEAPLAALAEHPLALDAADLLDLTSTNKTLVRVVAAATFTFWRC